MRKHLQVSLFVILFGVLISQSYLIYVLKVDVNNDILNLKDSTTILNDKVDLQKDSLSLDISNLRKETSKAVESLGGNIDQLKEDNTQSQEQIKKLTKDVKDLENVQIEASQDFSSIVEDVIPSVVSIRAGNSIGSGVFISSK